MELGEDLPLVDNRLDAPLSDDSGLAHLFHCEVLLSLLALDSPDFAEAALSDAVVIHKVTLGHS